MKKFLSLVLVGAFIFSGSAVLAESFPDVSGSHKNAEAISDLVNRGAISGYDNGDFGPEDGVTRAQAAKIIVLAFGLDHSQEFESTFNDVSEGDWHFEFVMAGVEEGLINGRGDGSFGPDDPVNLAATLKMSVIAGGFELPDSSSLPNSIFSDVGKGDWFAPHSQFAKDNNIVFSDENGSIGAETSMTRGSFAEVIYRLLQVKENGGNPFPIDTNWAIFESFRLPFRMKYDDSTWKVERGGDSVIFYYADNGMAQFSPVRVWQSSARVWLAVDKNDDNLDQGEYFDNLRSVFSGSQFTEFSLDGAGALEILDSNERTVDWYIYLSDGTVLAVFSEYGSGPIGFTHQQFIKTMLSTLELKALTFTPSDQLLSEILGSTLKEGKGTEMLNKLTDKVIIETDTIGVGTGPVDYYYSAQLNYTFKYERSMDVILDAREGETTAF